MQASKQEIFLHVIMQKELNCNKKYLQLYNKALYAALIQQGTHNFAYNAITMMDIFDISYIWSTMLYSSLNALLKLSKSTSLQKLFLSDCIQVRPLILNEKETCVSGTSKGFPVVFRHMEMFFLSLLADNVRLKNEHTSSTLLQSQIQIINIQGDQINMAVLVWYISCKK